MKPQMPRAQRLCTLISAAALSVLLLAALLVFLHGAQPSVEAIAVTASAAPLDNTLRVRSTEPATLDPALTSYADEWRIVSQVFERLVRLDENSSPQPALASSWTCSADASVYTFTLREAYFTNGRRVVAADVVNSIMRSLSPTISGGNPAPYASILYDIQGATAYNGGDTSASVGVRALDSSTVHFDLVGMVAPVVFLKKLALPIASVVPIEEINAGGALWWREPARYVGTGPFKLTEWITTSHISLTANSQHHAGPPPLSGIRRRFITDTNTALEAYRAGELDLLPLSVTDVPTVTADPLLATDMITGPGGCVSYLFVDNQKSPFTGTSGVKLRQAFNYAVNKTAFLSATMNNIGVPAKGLLSPWLYGYNPGLHGLDCDLALATQRLGESGYTPGVSPPIVFYTRTSTTALRVAQLQNLRTQLFDNLGVYTVLSPTLPPGRASISNWCADYPDPENFLPLLLRTGASWNLAHYSNPTFDALVDQAARTITESERIALYQQAEQLAVSDAALLPLYHDELLLLKKPRVIGPAMFDWQWYRAFSDLAFPHVYLPLVVR